MLETTYEERRRLERIGRDELARHQLERLNGLLAAILPENRFYADKLTGSPAQLGSLEQLTELPLTTKTELIGTDESSPLAQNLTHPVDRYVRFHQTSGTSGRPMLVLDTALDWQWWINAWQYVLDAAELTAEERAMMAFSFGPFIGFWSAHDALIARGGLAIPSGGMSTAARLKLLAASGATAVFCTPTYALRMAEVAAETHFDLARLPVRTLVVAGEPGGSMPAVRAAIEAAWNAAVVDHSGASEVGPWGYGDAQGAGLWLNEAEFIAEFMAVETGKPAGEGELAELVMTNLGRFGCPTIRYRTGDLVRPSWQGPGERRFVFLPGGVLGRSDDMLIVRGVNVFPSSIEEILRGFPEVAEFRVTATCEGKMDQLEIEVEDRAQAPDRIAQELEVRLGLRIAVRSVSAGSLPRFEAKSQRFVDQRGS